MLVTALLEIIDHILYYNNVERYMWLVAIIWVTSLNPVGQWIIQANICGLFATLYVDMGQPQHLLVYLIVLSIYLCLHNNYAAPQ